MDLARWRSYQGPVETPAPTSAPRVVVLGGGYVAINVCKALRESVANREIDLTVVSGDNFQTFHGFVGEMITGRLSPSHILSPVRRMFAPARVRVGEIEKLDLAGRRAVVARQLDGHRTEITWDHVVIALGTEDRTDAYPGLEEHAFKLRQYRDCFALKNHILAMFEQAEFETEEAERRRLLTFFVAGGGYAGTEVVGELADFARRLTRREYPRVNYDECRFILVHPGPTILPELYGNHPKLVEYGEAHMRELGVEVRTGTRVEFATPNEVTLSNGERIPTRTIVSTVGTRPNPLVAALDLPKDERGRIRTERSGRVEGHENIWAGGDCSAFPMPRGGDSPSVALYAYKHGTHIGKNLRRTLVEGKRPRRFRFPGLGQGASIGRRTAVAELYGIEITGLLAWVIWRVLLTYYFPSWDRRLHLMADWLIWPLVGRDVVAMRVGEGGEYEVRHNVYGPAEIIVTEQRAGRYIHIIVEGEVEILHSARGQEVVLTTLGPGDHFGQRWLESLETESARAKTAVRTLAVRRDQAPQLQEVLRSTGPLVAQSGHFPVMRQEGG
jgi:NADH:ubiquinone reductase (H+-translocating)